MATARLTRSAGAPARPDGTARAKQRVHDPQEAQEILSRAYLPHKLWVTPGEPLELELARGRFGDLTAGVVSYGQPVHLLTAETTDFHFNVTLDGRAASASGRSGSVVTTSGQAVAFKVGEPAHLTWSADCRQLCFMAPRSRVEAELEQLLGRSLTMPLAFEETLRTDMSPSWHPTLRLVEDELAQEPGAMTRPAVARHLEGLIIDALLLTQPHNYQEVVTREAAPGSSSAITYAAELLETRPGDPWTVVRLAQQANVSVRALQYGFCRDFDLSPMAYLRRVRLQHAHRALLAASPETTTVRAVALECGLIHPSRFAAAYGAVFGESPSKTLHRP